MATCAEIRAQLASLRKDRDFLVSEVVSDEGDLKELESEASQINPTILANARTQLGDDKAKLKQVNDQITALSQTYEAQCQEEGQIQKQPQSILEIQFANPDLVDIDHPDQVKDVDALYAQAIALGHADPSTSITLGGAFPSLEAQQEWKQVLPADLNDPAHNADYEGPNLVGATGWVLNPEFSLADVPFDHPFGFDWEFMLALDQPVDDPKRYTFLLTPGDQTCEEEGYREAVQQASSFAPHKPGHPNPISDVVDIPQGPDGLPNLLGVEIDRGLVPQQFTGGVVQGDRIAVFGRWIVDCGHQKRITICGEDDDHNVDIHPGIQAFRTEIHPPLLMAAARVTTGSLLNPTVLNEPTLTRVLFTSRPYLVSQRFTIDTDTIYDDTASDDGPYVWHMIQEVIKVNEIIAGIPIGSVQVEAHPKITSFPFQGSYELHLTVRPPPLPPNQMFSPGLLYVSFQFTVRSGCTVQVTASGPDSIDIVIRLNQEGYTPPKLPNRRERTWTKEDLGKLDADAAKAYVAGEWISAGIQFFGLGSPIGAAEVTAILEQGILTDEYDIDKINSMDILDASHAVSVFAQNIPAGQVGLPNDNQPFPVYGWIEVGYAPPPLHV